eukprot:TRINITY_DN4815_c0_g1_i3.p4 TRINITY_DN4815_c0_g1~~TRINITY_DN4815_c0_g1_i3.p4  ORF type:complete len:112 (-),score=25.49 TRINITY_DN4815_c0_g1_i3:377-712(-)
MKWYRKDPDFDALIVGTFHTRISEFVAMDTESLCTDIALVNPQAWAAVLVVLDQFTRNAYRNTPGGMVCCGGRGAAPQISPHTHTTHHTTHNTPLPYNPQLSVETRRRCKC